MIDKKQLLISVVVPTYNRADLITDALESVRAQTYRPLELIVVDDGSTDETQLVVQNWIATHVESDEFIARLIAQENRGGNPARNQGIREAAGDYVAFLDSDDRWHPDKLKKQFEVIQNHPQMGAVYCGLRHWFADEDRVEESPRDYPSGDLLSQILVHDVTAPTSCYLIRAAVFCEVGLFDETLQARQDWDMWIRVAARYSIGVVPEALVDYREHAGVRTASDPWKEIKAYRTIMEKYANLRAAQSFHVRQAAKASFFRRMGRVYFHQRISTFKAFGFQFRAILAWPFIFDSYAALFGMLLPRGGRQMVHRGWNKIFGSTALAIKSH